MFICDHRFLNPREAQERVPKEGQQTRPGTETATWGLLETRRKDYGWTRPASPQGLPAEGVSVWTWTCTRHSPGQPSWWRGVGVGES